VKVAAVQHDISWEDRDATLAHVAPMVAKAAAEGARLVVLPEMFAIGFSMTPEQTAEPEGGPTSAWLADQARTHDLWIGGSVPERSGGRPRNVFVLAGPDGTVHRYAKVHPFTYSGEHEHYDAGDELVTVTVDGLRVSLFVCYDLRFADEFWDRATETDLYLVVASWPQSRAHHWRSLLLARAIENQAYVLGCNRVGDGDGTHYAGGSCIVDPMGQVLSSEGDHEAILVAEVDPATVAATRERFPFLRDRRR
jgi:predicted amidohydrolase